MKEETKRRSALQIMGRLIVLVKPLFPIMLAAIVLGTVGYLCAISLTILAGQVVLRGLAFKAGEGLVWPGWRWLGTIPVNRILTAMLVLALLRGILHYAEQYCNHFIAFKLLAIVRHKVFAVLRKLCPAKLEVREKGNLISILTTDIELLEVFYAHTISPIAIAVCTSAIMVAFLGHYHWMPAMLACLAYLVVGAGIPLWVGREGGPAGMDFRTSFGELNSFVLDALRGLEETIQYGQGEKKKEEIEARSRHLAGLQEDLSRLEGMQRAFTNAAILLASFGMLALTVWLHGKGELGFDGVLTCTIAMMGSFGPVAALSGLSNNLHQTLASGERVLSLLEETPVVEELAGTLPGNREQAFAEVEARTVTFSYEKEKILDHFSLKPEPGKITGIYGASGSGKSTFLKLLMRFWDVQEGSIRVNDTDVREIPTKTLRETEGYVTQETHLFHDSIAKNIGLAKAGADREEIIAAAKKAAIHDFIMTLPDGYDTEVGELGDTLSGGEKQRIGIARAFLHDARLLLLDEPTSNLDVLNEGIILRSLKEQAEEKTVILVSHRESTLRVADQVVKMETGRVS